MKLNSGQALTWIWRQSRGRVKRALGGVEFKVIVATDADHGVGAFGALPWPHFPEDMKHFKDMTMGHPVVMGKATARSLPKPLAGRPNVVVTHDGREGMSDQQVLEEALNEAAYSAKGGIVWIIGGPSLWEQCFDLDIVDEVVMTLINDRFVHDTVFPYRAMHGATDTLGIDRLKAWRATTPELLAIGADGFPYANVVTYRRER